MRSFEYNGGKAKLSKVIQNQYPDLSYNKIQKLLRERNIKVDDVRIKEDYYIFSGFVEVFLPEFRIKSVFEDENLIVVFKPKGIKSDGQNSVSELYKNEGYFLCHRLDTNTDGLLILAKSARAENEVKKAFKAHLIQKHYKACVYGSVRGSGELVSYLKKDSANGFVKVYKEEIPGSVKAVTKYAALDEKNNLSVVDVSPITGKTHQIRAQLASIGHFILGDTKYGNEAINNEYGLKKQMLTAYKLILRFPRGSFLSYLNDNVIIADENDYHCSLDRFQTPHSL